MLDELEKVIRSRRTHDEKGWKIENEYQRTLYELGGKLAPLEGAIKNVKIAYEIVSIPVGQITDKWCKDYSYHVKEGDVRIEQTRGRESVELNDTELAILRKLCEVPRFSRDRMTGNLTPLPALPFDPQKRTYRFSDVPSLYPEEEIPGANPKLAAACVRFSSEEAPEVFPVPLPSLHDMTPGSLPHRVPVAPANSQAAPRSG
jgi:hypothetical protein